MFDPYIHFQGNCAEAMAFYAVVFDGAVTMTRYRDAPDFAPGTEGADLVMHATLTVADRILMGGDFPPGVQGQAQMAFSLSHVAASAAGARKIFDRLAQGGDLIFPFAETYWAEGFGMVRDRFGTHWMVSGPERLPARRPYVSLD